MSKKHPLHTYRNVQATTCDPAQLLLLLYDKTKKKKKKAILLLQSYPADTNQAGYCLVKAHLGVMELDKTLNFKALPELAQSLHSLYLHVLLLLGEGIGEFRVDSLQRAHSLLSDLRRTWDEAARNSTRGEAAV